MAELTAARYGKDNIRLYKVHRDEATGVQSIAEMTVCSLLEGDIETSYTRADNSVIVATDTQKQTTYIIAKQHPVLPIERFASTLGAHFVATYPHIHGANIHVAQQRWTRLTVDGAPHPHSFAADAGESRYATAVAKEQGIVIRSELKGLRVLKSTGSAFHGFHRDEYAKLPETWDRILSTEVECAWTWRTFPNKEAVDAAADKFDGAFEKVKRITLDMFAKDNSASVQNTMYKMAELILEAVPEIEKVEYLLPNRHYFEIDLSWHKGLKNTGKDAEVYAPQTDPNGLIECTVSRKRGQSKL
jgi:urate oxidase